MDDLREMVQRALHGDVAWVVRDALGAPGDLFEEEKTYVTRAIQSRQQEFAAGRSALRDAMAALGHPGAAILRRPDRSPIWPAGLVGSLCHSTKGQVGGVCVAAMGHAHRFRGLGVDIEPALALDGDLMSRICTPEELHRMEGLPEADRHFLGKRIFSAKEAAYKCQFEVTRRIFGFQVLDITFDGDAFTARFREPIGPFAVGDTLLGCSLVNRDWIFSSAVLQAE